MAQDQSNVETTVTEHTNESGEVVGTQTVTRDAETGEVLSVETTGETDGQGMQADAGTALTREHFDQKMDEVVAAIAAHDASVSQLGLLTGGDFDGGVDALVSALGSGGDSGESARMVVLSDRQFNKLQEYQAAQVVGSLVMVGVLALVVGLMLARSFTGRWQRG